MKSNKEYSIEKEAEEELVDRCRLQMHFVTLWQPFNTRFHQSALYDAFFIVWRKTNRRLIFFFTRIIRPFEELYSCLHYFLKSYHSGFSRYLAIRRKNCHTIGLIPVFADNPVHRLIGQLMKKEFRRNNSRTSCNGARFGHFEIGWNWSL